MNYARRILAWCLTVFIASVMVPVEMTYENYQACAAPKRLLIVPGAEHGMSYLVDKAGYEAALMQFWADYDKITT